MAVRWYLRFVSPTGSGPELASADYPERRYYGRYLRAMFDQLCAHAPAEVRVHPVRGAATGLYRDHGGHWLTVDHGRQRLRVDKIVLATWHAELVASEGDRELREHADLHRGLHYIGQGLTTDMPMSVIAPGMAVAVRGLRLTCYDVLRSLTLGRGGRFHRSTDGTLRYFPEWS